MREGFIMRIRRKKKGQGLVEYAVLVAVVAAVLVMTMGTLKTAISNLASKASSAVTNAGTA
jgi:Flp pilus assembly pilin Flp